MPDWQYSETYRRALLVLESHPRWRWQISMQSGIEKPNRSQPNKPAPERVYFYPHQGQNHELTRLHYLLGSDCVADGVGDDSEDLRWTS